MQLIRQVKSLENLSLYKCFARTIMNLAESKDDAHSGTVLHVLRAPRNQVLHRDTVFYDLGRKNFVWLLMKV